MKCFLIICLTIIYSSLTFAAPSPLDEASVPRSNVLSEEQKRKFATAEPEDITNENFPEEIESFDFPNAEIADVVKAISELTGKNFIIESTIRGKITIVAPTRITVADAYKAFLTALAVNGFTIVPSGKFLKIRSSRNAQSDSIETYSGDYYPNSDQLITRIIHMKHISASQIERDLTKLISKDGALKSYESTNSIIVTDYGSNIERLSKILSQLDRPGFEEQLKVVAIRYAKAKDIADLIDQILNKDSKGSKGGINRSIPSFRRSPLDKGSDVAQYDVISDERTNSLIIVGNKAGIEKIEKLIAQLDFKIKPEDAGGVYVYYVKHQDAESLAKTLEGVAQSASSGGLGSSKSPLTMGTLGNFKPPQAQRESIFGGDVKITADKNTNSLIVVASKQDYEAVLSLLNKIDKPRDQVYVEAIIMEITLSDNMDYGITYFQFDKASKGMGRAGFSSGNLETLFNPTATSGAILGFGSGDRFTIKTAAGDTEISSLVGFLTFLKTNAKTNILSTPQLIALNNETASIEVGDKVPTSISATPVGTTGAVTQNVTFENATIKLEITPYISPSSDTIRLKVDQNISKPSATAPTASALAQNAIQLSQRTLKTNVVVQARDTVVLGGLMKDEEIEQTKKVPLLGDIPILGWLFKSRKTDVVKNNLMIFLTPTIIRSRQESRELLGRKIDERLDYIKSGDGRDRHGEFFYKMQQDPNDALVTNPAENTAEVKDAPVIPPAAEEDILGNDDNSSNESVLPETTEE